MSKHTKDIDTMFEEIKAQMTEQIEANNKAELEQLVKENNELKDLNKKLSIAARRTDEAKENSDLMNLLINQLKNKIQLIDDGEDKAELVYDFLDCFFEIDFQENTYEAPLWLGCATLYYNNRKTVIEILKLLDFKVPDGIDNFRLPHEWTEEELDVFFDYMGNHVVCNNCYFKDNLRYWKPNALRNPLVVCKENFSETPWQFVLRNPLLKKEKYLTKIGEMFCAKDYRSDQWLKFAKITEYQELTDEELKLIINNIKYAFYKNNCNDLIRFLFANIHLIEDEAFLEILYKYNYNSYDFKYTNTILKMPYKFIKQYVKDTDNFNLEWLKRNKDRFTKEQLRELTLLAMGTD